MNSPESGPYSQDDKGPANSTLSVLVVVPVYNGGRLWHEAASALARARDSSEQNVRVKVVDSTSVDDSASVARANGFHVSTISSADFDHGGTRNAAVHNESADVYVFLTQDAVLERPDALDALLVAFADKEVAVAYGRQLAHHDANPIAAHARHFNYGAHNYVAGMADRNRLGIKTVFASNSFAAYRASAFKALGGFPEQNILSEDMYLAARAVKGGWKVAYVASACVRHSHNYTPLEEFRRYFDIGVFQADHPWIRETFGAAEGEGMRFVKSEIRALLARSPLWLPRAFLHNALKMLGYRIGQHYRILPPSWNSRLSMQPGYWKRRGRHSDGLR